MKDIKVLISSILILVSFFLWFIFSENKNQYKNNINLNNKNYVNLEILKTKIKITKDKNTIITVNWEVEENNIIDLK